MEEFPHTEVEFYSLTQVEDVKATRYSFIYPEPLVGILLIERTQSISSVMEPLN